MPENNQGITFVAAVAKVVTLADNGIRVTFDLPEDAIAEAAWLMMAKRDGIAVKVHCVAGGGHSTGGV